MEGKGKAEYSDVLRVWTLDGVMVLVVEILLDVLVEDSDGKGKNEYSEALRV